MPALFSATGAFAVPSRKLYVIHGSIVSGTIQKGMKMHVGVNSQMAITLRIDGVEFVLKSGASELALCTTYDSDDELTVLEGLNVGGEEIRISD